MANTTADKLAKLEATKSAMKTAINGSGNLVGDVFADYPGAVNDFRSKVATAITAKGVATSATDTPDQMAANIGAIESGGEGLLIPNTVFLQKLFNPVSTSQSIVMLTTLVAPAMLRTNKVKLVEYNIYESEVPQEDEQVIHSCMMAMADILSKYTDMTQISLSDLSELTGAAQTMCVKVGLTPRRFRSNWCIFEADKAIVTVEPV